MEPERGEDRQPWQFQPFICSHRDKLVQKCPTGGLLPCSHRLPHHDAAAKLDAKSRPGCWNLRGEDALTSMRCSNY